MSGDGFDVLGVVMVMSGCLGEGHGGDLRGTMIVEVRNKLPDPATVGCALVGRPISERIETTLKCVWEMHTANRGDCEICM